MGPYCCADGWHENRVPGCLKMGATRHRQGGQPIQQLAGLGGDRAALLQVPWTCFTAITYGNQLRSAPAPEANAPA